MGKKKSTFLNMTLTLLITTVVAGVSLGFINDITKGPKAKAKLEQKINALRSVLPEFNNNPVDEVLLVKTKVARDSVELYPAFKDSTRVGTAVVGSSEKGYSGLIKIMVGFNPDGSINNIEVLEQKETPGLGTKMKEDKFIRQFRGKHPSTFSLEVKKDKGDVDALTGATITTRAFNEATQMAYDVMIEQQKNPEN
ncbi:RnfABCDGE type electron transport complex subunit G [Aureitalea sp. L0-47]|uniref:RnfABCDGE type electron transport complex subunit G n=1 Tax=Aureitalea sp. L0-47 TaxID=2816962 RepID=UPI0022390571|nr:RnfABCDGE type electron transport complex subunit G [Aureitalea sp. L0-47]MCW5518461.1 RnfABCDGE type electron transport complex subunit G [Aureitalea sp. L0-47]